MSLEQQQKAGGKGSGYEVLCFRCCFAGLAFRFRGLNLIISCPRGPGQGFEKSPRRTTAGPVGQKSRSFPVVPASQDGE